MTEKTRTLRTPTEKAIAALGVEQRRVDKLKVKHGALNTTHEEVHADLLAARARRDYLAQNPDLPDDIRDDASPSPTAVTYRTTP